ncbi:MAG TPA: hypothetical protein VK698_39410 [Kofleriaceae bacterium]|nr:hypothetical protein [Kofleriaceae bacterium]
MPSTDKRKVLKEFPAGDPRGSWPAERYADKQRANGRRVEVVLDLASDKFVVFIPAGAVSS